MQLLLRFFSMVLFSIGALITLSACGNKGPLYLPDNEPLPISITPTTPPAAATTTLDETIDGPEE